MTDAIPTIERERFIELFAQSVLEGRLVKLGLGNYRGREPQLQRVFARPIELHQKIAISFLQRYKTRDLTRNLPPADAAAELRGLLEDGFSHAHLQSTDGEVELMVSKKGQETLRLKSADDPAEPAAPEPHDRSKQRWVQLGEPWLVELGVTDATHRLVPAMARKWKQINKFVEVLDHAIASSTLADAKSLRVLDFGSGKGYLTFAVADHLKKRRGADVQVTGVELREDMVTLCNAAAERSGVTNLNFETGNVQSRQGEPTDIMIALHACDTATDYAMHAGIQAGAAIIMCAPCCHKQVRPQMTMPALLKPMLNHGVHLGQQAEMLTDTLRAMLLDAHGYDTQVFEFVALEHTSKNKMILAVRRNGRADTPQAQRRRDDVLAQIAELKQFYGIREHCLESLLAEPA